MINIKKILISIAFVSMIIPCLLGCGNKNNEETIFNNG